MNNLNINAGLGLIKRIAPSRENKLETSNPFASNPFGLSFKGKVLKADIFEPTAKTGVKENIIQKGKIAASAVVGSLVDFKSAAAGKFKPVIDFGRKIKAHANEIADKINKFDLTQFRIPSLTKATEETSISKEVRVLMEKPKEELGEMLEKEIAALPAA